MSVTLAIPYADMAKQEINDFREKFDCGEPSLNEYLVQTMGQHNKKGITPSFLLPSTDPLHPLIGYYSLTHGQLDCSYLAEATQKKLKLPNTVPILRLSRLAIDKHFKNKGFGKILMAEVFHRAQISKQNGGCVFIVVDALNHDAKAYYEKYGFESTVSNPLQLYLKV